VDMWIRRLRFRCTEKKPRMQICKRATRLM